MAQAHERALIGGAVGRMKPQMPAGSQFVSTIRPQRRATVPFQPRRRAGLGSTELLAVFGSSVSEPGPGRETGICFGRSGKQRSEFRLAPHPEQGACRLPGARRRLGARARNSGGNPPAAASAQARGHRHGIAIAHSLVAHVEAALHQANRSTGRGSAGLVLRGR